MFFLNFKDIMLNKSQLVNEFRVKFTQVMGTDSLFIFIDEANPLSMSDNNENAINKFRILRRASRNLFSGLRCLIVLAQTASRVSDFFTNPQHVTPSEREAKPHRTMSPFNQIFFFDVHFPQEYRNLFESDQFGYKSLTERKPVETLYMLGRPLWPSYIKNKYTTVKLMELARRKLICCDSFKFVEEKNEFLATLAVLCSRTTLMIEYNSSYGSDLVANYMSVLVHISEQRDWTASTYISEPILSDAAAQVL